MLKQAHLQKMKQPLGEAACLPGFVYRDADFENIESERVFERRWISVGHGNLVPTRGDIYPVSVGQTPLILVRGLDDRLRVFHNVCRHRGLKLLECPESRPHGSITCPYHGWTYKLDGRCAAIPYWNRSTGERRVPESDAGYGLREVRSHVWLDIVFVNISGTALPFEDYISPLHDRLSASSMSPLACISKWQITAPGNWKLVIENYMDAYHLSFVHPQVGTIKSAAEHDNLSLSKDIWGASYRLASKTRAWSDPLPDIPELRRALGPNSEAYIIFPNTLVFLQPTFIALRTVLPYTTNTAWEAELIYISTEALTDDWIKQRKQIVEAAQVINEQDLPIIARLQATRGSSMANECRFVPDWDIRSHRFQTRVAESVLE